MASQALTRAANFLPSVFDDFFKPWFDTNGDNNWALTVPAVNISETQESYKVDLAAPGLKKDDFKVNVDGDLLTISAEKEETKEEADEKTSRREYNYSSFSRSFTLPESINREKIEANYNDGILKLVLPKKDEAKKAAISKKIDVK